MPRSLVCERRYVLLIISRLSLDIVGISVTNRCDAATSAPFAFRSVHRRGITLQRRGALLRHNVRAARSTPARVARGAVYSSLGGILGLLCDGLLSVGLLGCRLGSGRRVDWHPPFPIRPLSSMGKPRFLLVLPCSAAENMKESRRLANGCRHDIARSRRDDYRDER